MGPTKQHYSITAHVILANTDFTCTCTCIQDNRCAESDGTRHLRVLTVPTARLKTKAAVLQCRRFCRVRVFAVTIRSGLLYADRSQCTRVYL